MQLLNTLCFSVKPIGCQCIVLEVFFRLLQYFLVIGVEPRFLGISEHVCVDQVPAIRNHSDMFETKEGLVSKGVFGWDLLHHDNIFDANAVVAIFVESRFI